MKVTDGCLEFDTVFHFFFYRGDKFQHLNHVEDDEASTVYIQVEGPDDNDISVVANLVKEMHQEDHIDGFEMELTLHESLFDPYQPDDYEKYLRFAYDLSRKLKHLNPDITGIHCPIQLKEFENVKWLKNLLKKGNIYNETDTYKLFNRPIELFDWSYSIQERIKKAQQILRKIPIREFWAGNTIQHYLCSAQADTSSYWIGFHIVWTPENNDEGQTWTEADSEFVHDLVDDLNHYSQYPNNHEYFGGKLDRLVENSYPFSLNGAQCVISSNNDAAIDAMRQTYHEELESLL